MKVNYNVNEAGRFLSLTKIPFDETAPTLELDDNFDLNSIYEYKLEDGKLIHDPLPPPEPTAEEKIADLKAKLAETDYIVIKIAEGAATFEEYADVIDQRQAWREQINELELL